MIAGEYRGEEAQRATRRQGKATAELSAGSGGSRSVPGRLADLPVGEPSVLTEAGARSLHRGLESGWSL